MGKNTDSSVFYARMEELTVFAGIEELNEYMKAVRYYFADKLNGTDRALLDHIARYAIKHVGAFGQRWATIAEELGKGVSTIRTSAAKLERLGIIKRHAQIRPKRGGNGANIITFVKDAVEKLAQRDAEEVEAAADQSTDIDKHANEQANKHPQPSMRGHEENPDAATDKAAFSETKALNSFNTLLKASSKNIKRITTYSDSLIDKDKEELPEELGKDYAHYEVPAVFINAIIPIGRTPKTINHAWQRVRIAYANSGLEKLDIYLDEYVADQQLLGDLIKRTKSVVGGYKTGTVRDFYAVLYI